MSGGIIAAMIGLLFVAAAVATVLTWLQITPNGPHLLGKLKSRVVVTCQARVAASKRPQQRLAMIERKLDALLAHQDATDILLDQTADFLLAVANQAIALRQAIAAPIDPAVPNDELEKRLPGLVEMLERAQHYRGACAEMQHRVAVSRAMMAPKWPLGDLRNAR